MRRPRADTIIFFTDRIEELARFYVQGLQLTDENRMGEVHIGFELPDGVYLGFDKADEPPAEGGGTSIWFDVEDLEATFRRFVDLGATVRYPPTLKPMGDVLASLVDLDGNVFGLVSR